MNSSTDVWENLKDFFYQGDPDLRTWFLVRNNFAPFIICGLYVLVVKVLGPAFMRNRKPYNLRNAMIAYNSIIVAIYAICLSRVVYLITQMDRLDPCERRKLLREDGTLTIMTYGWYGYMLKYVEFLDTIFFIMRKRNDLVTNLHVIHHASIPIIAWLIMRTETSLLQGIIAFNNSVVHVIMYSYYALAAVGPEVRKYLWWKRYLTILQMSQFVIVLMLQIVIIPLLGCYQSRFTLYLNVVGATMFLLLFYNFYRHAFKARSEHKVKEK